MFELFRRRDFREYDFTLKNQLGINACYLKKQAKKKYFELYEGWAKDNRPVWSEKVRVLAKRLWMMRPLYVNTHDKTYLTADGPQLVIFDPGQRRDKSAGKKYQYCSGQRQNFIDSAAIILLANNDIPIVIAETKTRKRLDPAVQSLPAKIS